MHHFIVVLAGCAVLLGGAILASLVARVTGVSAAVIKILAVASGAVTLHLVPRTALGALSTIARHAIFPTAHAAGVAVKIIPEDTCRTNRSRRAART